jgi:hypothetical protein
MSLTRRAFFRTLAGSETHRLPAERFFQHYTHPVPNIHVPYWSFAIGGLVRHPLILSYADLLDFPTTEIPCTVLCAANEPGGERIGHALWRGIPLQTLLDELELPSAARFAKLSATGGHVTGITLEQLRTGIIATHMNGKTLRPEDGFPARLIIPGLYDHKMPRWIERIELRDTPFSGLWETSGWADTVSVTSAITAPKPSAKVRGLVRLEGYAYAGLNAIDKIEISIDDGPWMPVEFTPPEPGCWTRWYIDWQPSITGAMSLTVCASDSAGIVQPIDCLHRLALVVESLT